jgi:isopentenyl diphosphate isomerase/L-lactate dehydrogenase-like FMN-dependent dehydrogenase
MKDAINIDDLRFAARRRLPRMIFDFIDGGAEDEVTLRENRAAWERVRLLPRVVRDVSKLDTATEVLDGPSAWPFVIAPTGSGGMAWPGVDVAIARAAAELGIPYTLSTNATVSIEEIAEKAPGRLWFQLYVLHDRAFTERLVARAAAAGYEALVVTVDLATGGKRERDARNGFVVPYRMQLRHLWQGATHPRWAARILANGGFPEFVNVRGLQHIRRADAMTVSSVMATQLDESFDDAKLARLRELWRGKFVVKGVSRADDALRLVALGADAIWVSNHGGRQLDGAIASLDAVPAIAAALGGRVPVLVDGGVRRGADALKARALGAQAVALGRATLFGGAAAGEAGARRALEILCDELRRAMKLCGLASIAEADASLVAPSASGG